MTGDRPDSSYEEDLGRLSSAGGEGQCAIDERARERLKIEAGIGTPPRQR